MYSSNVQFKIQTLLAPRGGPHSVKLFFLMEVWSTHNITWISSSQHGDSTSLHSAVLTTDAAVITTHCSHSITGSTPWVILFITPSLSVTYVFSN